MGETITPSAADRSVATGILREKSDDRIVLAIPDTDYLLHLAPTAPIEGEIGKRISGTIRCQAKRIDRIRTGGRYIEPVEGRPRRVQGRVLSVNDVDDSIVVSAGAPVICRTDERQRAQDFSAGEMVSMNVLAGATFTPVSG